jgi:N-acetylglucosaminyldiphosphoundecaprenol N-acetyl-beta-D-mannosaminyltransferase
MTTKLPKKDILEIGITDATEKEVLEYVVNFIENEKGQLFITTPNPEILVYAKHNKAFADILKVADISLADGIGVVVAGAILGKSLKSRITGIDFMKNLCEKISKKPITVGFLGGKGDVALKTSECLEKEFWGLDVVLAEAGNPDDFTAKKIQKEFAKDQRPTTIDILFVGFGFPRQEEWIAKYLPELPVRVAMTVGGSFDTVSVVCREHPWLCGK